MEEPSNQGRKAVKTLIAPAAPKTLITSVLLSGALIASVPAIAVSGEPIQKWRLRRM